MDRHSIWCWMKTGKSFSSQSLLTRQILSAISGLLVNFLITPLVVCFTDDDFQSSSLKRALLLTLVSSMPLAFIWRYLKSQNCYRSDTAGFSDPTGQKISSDYSVFTCFRFPVPDNLHPYPPQRLLVAEETAQLDNKRKTAPVPICSELSSSLSEPPPSPIKGKGKLRSSRKTNQLKHMNPKSSVLHQNLLHPRPTYQEEAGSVKKGRRNTARQASGSASSPQLGMWAWEFMEEASFAKFKSDYAKFRSINSSSLGALPTDMFRNEAAWRNMNRRRRGESDASQQKQAPPRVSLGKDDDDQLQKPAAPLQVVTSEPNGGGVRKMGEKRTKCSGCLKTILSSFCFRQRKNEQRRWNSRRFRQISHAPLLWSPSTVPQQAAPPSSLPLQWPVSCK